MQTIQHPVFLRSHKSELFREIFFFCLHCGLVLSFSLPNVSMLEILAVFWGSQYIARRGPCGMRLGTAERKSWIESVTLL